MFLICLLLIINTFLFFHNMLVLFIYIIVNIISVALWKGDIFLSYQTMCLESIHIFNCLFLQSPIFSTRRICYHSFIGIPLVLKSTSHYLFPQLSSPSPITVNRHNLDSSTNIWFVSSSSLLILISFDVFGDHWLYIHLYDKIYKTHLEYCLQQQVVESKTPPPHKFIRSIR